MTNCHPSEVIFYYKTNSISVHKQNIDISREESFLPPEQHQTSSEQTQEMIKHIDVSVSYAEKEINLQRSNWSNVEKWQSCLDNTDLRDDQKLDILLDYLILSKDKLGLRQIQEKVSAISILSSEVSIENLLAMCYSQRLSLFQRIHSNQNINILIADELNEVINKCLERQKERYISLLKDFLPNIVISQEQYEAFML